MSSPNTSSTNNCSSDECNNNNINTEANQSILLFLQLLSNSAILQQALSAITQNSQLIEAPTFPKLIQTLLALSNAIIGFPQGSAQNSITKEEWKQWKKAKRPEEDWKDFL
ncbi:17194_t:CDS:2, partial [Cetraspora pellucida]